MNEKGRSVPKIVAFQKADAKKLAELFNSFDKEGLWPGGFTGGVPFTAERVLSSFPAGVKSISILISTHRGQKSGIFWVPEASVYIQDFVPGILNFPLAREFFKKHDWYSSQVRKLELVPDEFRLEEMEVFPYEFAEGKDNLKVWVDRYGRGIVGVERTLEGKHLRVMCRLKDHKVIAGLEHELLIEVANDTKSSMHGSLFF